MKPLLLFDFDGTLADSLDLGLKIANNLAPVIGRSPMTHEEIQHLRSMPLAKAFKELKIHFWLIPGLISKALVQYRHLLHEIEPFESIHDMLLELKHLGISVALLTSNTKENVNAFLKHWDMEYFDWVEGTSGILKKHNSIRRQINKHKLDKERVLYVGDEVRDIDAAHHCGIKVIAVSWGFHTKDLLVSHDPDYLVDTPQQIVSIAREIFL
ncbi:MAG TPA: HAD-IA family hydrolase [Candidatus Cloacimonadota bacterium]|nr:HAD-IA family hydrolase [Candidatus Cloacimonadota bacterium]